jgi:hypothetical protein
MCLPVCDDGTCPEGSVCAAGACVPAREPTATVTIDPTMKHQTLIGFGASLAHDEELIVESPNKERLFEVMFEESGFDAIRMRNRYEEGNVEALASVVEIISAATARLGRSPTLFMSSGSPPAALKANGARACVDSEMNCTLSRDADGNFDYGGLAEHWRASLEAYQELGIHPDFVSIQSNPDWNPQEEDAAEACHFLPQEGVASVTAPDGEVQDVEFAGYAQAMEAVLASVGTLPSQYSFFGPEVGSVGMLEAYSEAATSFESLAYHLYDTDPSAVVREAFEAVSTLSAQTGRTSVQSAVRADGLGTAILAHYALAVADSGGFLQQQFVGAALDESSTALIGTTEATVEKLPAYHALFHFARFTDPGWVRVAAATDSGALLASAWLSPDGGALTVVLVNPTDAAMDVELVLPGSVGVGNAAVVRTVFDGVERSRALGLLSPSSVLRLPGQAIATIASSSN